MDINEGVEHHFYDTFNVKYCLLFLFFNTLKDKYAFYLRYKKSRIAFKHEILCAKYIIKHF